VRSFLIAVGLAVAALAYGWLHPDAGVRTWLRLRGDVAEAEARIRALEAENRTLADELEALRGDDFARERAVREELGWVRPGEVLVKVPTRDGADLPRSLTR
jgi:cell division protein FtsB